MQPERVGGRFKLGTNRRDELSFKQELDDVGKKSISLLSARKEAKRMELPTNSQKTARILAPEFIPSRPREKRKTQPVFHDDLQPKSSRAKSPCAKQPADVASYNPLDKVNAIIKPQVDKTKKSNKFPFNKIETVTISDLKRPQKTSLGVLPPRNSSVVPGMQVVMEGQSAIKSDQDPVLGPIERANNAAVVNVQDMQEEEKGHQEAHHGAKDLTEYRPAILAQSGTIQPVHWIEKPQPPAKPRSYIRHSRQTKSAVSMASSFKSVEIHIPDETVYSQYDDAIDDINQDQPISRDQTGSSQRQEERKSRTSSGQTVKSVKELLEEARQIASPGGEKLYVKRGVKKDDRKDTSPRSKRSGKVAEKKTILKKGGKSGKSDLKPHQGTIIEEVQQSSQRSVDEIIASLKDSSRQGVETDADRKIKEIMNRVLSQTQEVLGDISEEQQETDVETNPGDQNEETSQTEDIDANNIISKDVLHSENGDSERRMDKPDIHIELMDGKLETESKKSDVAVVLPPSMQEAMEQLDENELEKKDVEKLPPLDLTFLRTPSTQSSQDRQPTPDLKQAWQDLVAPTTVTKEDILSINANPSQLHAKPSPQFPLRTAGISTSFLSSWAPANKLEKDAMGAKKDIHSIHHFCTATEDIQLPDHQRGIWRTYHVPSKYSVLRTEASGGDDGISLSSNNLESPVPSVIEDTQSSRPSTQSSSSLRSSLSQQQSIAAKQIIRETTKLPTVAEESFETWATRAQEVFDKPEVGLKGKKVEIRDDESFLFWTLAPPKWDVPSNKVKAVLFPKYHGAALGSEMPESITAAEDSDESDLEEELLIDELDAEDREAIERTMNRKWHSCEDLTQSIKTRREFEERMKHASPAEDTSKMQTVESSVTLSVGSGTVTSRIGSGKPGKSSDTSEGGISSGKSVPAAPISFAEMRAKFSMAAVPLWQQHDPSDILDVQIFPILPDFRRRHSAPGCLLSEEDLLLIYEDFNSAMEEVSKQRQQLRDIKAGRRPPPGVEAEEMSEDDQQEMYSTSEDEPMESVKPERMSLLQEMYRDNSKPTPAELALEAGRAYVLLPKKRKKKKKVKTKRLDVAQMEQVEQFLRQDPNQLSRSESIPNIRAPVVRELRVPEKVRSHRRRSLVSDWEFEEFLARKGYKASEWENKREFVRSIWNIWFDQVFPPTPEESEWEESDPEEVVVTQEEKLPQRRPSEASTIFSESMEIYPIIEVLEDEETVELLQEEVARLDQALSAGEDKPNPFDLCRRGAILRKLGKIPAAKKDLDHAIALEPLMIGAYWHRHLVFLLLNKKTQAIEDLNFILKHKKDHSGAYRSRAAIFKAQGDITMSIINYSQAIKINPEDHEAYYQRAEMYEKQGEMLLAMEDYAMATKLQPGKTDALFKHGVHYFDNKNWTAAISDFTELLKQDNMDARAWTYRGRAQAKLGHWSAAVSDLSAAIHLDPRNATAFYHRGCILRKAHPKLALQDFSVSLLLDSSENNILSYLHRGILYNQIGQHEDAIPDFEALLKLDNEMAAAHVNLGLIYMVKMENYHRAVKKFTAAIKADPTYVKALVCRAEAYTKLHDIKNALLDFTRAIHLRPDVHHYYMYRGQLVLRTGNLELASFCVKHAAELNDTLGQSPTQQAIVQTFLRNYDKAIEALEGATRVKPVAPLFLLLGKTQMKARLWKDAVISFEKALEILKPWQRELSLPVEAAEMYYLIGMCHTEMRDYVSAHDAFNNAIRVDSRHAEAYYYRGLTRLRLKQSKGVQDFNRALAINPVLFQAYLSRAAYYGLRGRYTKAILNCNEAIKLQPNSVRAYLYRGALKYHIRAFALAIRDLSRAAQIDNTCSLAYFNRAVCYHDSGNHEKALQDYGIVLLLGDQLKLKILINRGLLYFERKDYQNALFDCLLASKTNPQDKQILHTLALCYHKLHCLKDAVATFTRALEIDPFFLDALIGRGNVFMDFGNEAGHLCARRDYERCLRLSAECLPGRVNLAYNLQVSGQYQQAWNQFTSAININPEFQPALEGRAIINLQMSDTFAAFQDISASIRVAASAELLTNRGVIHQFMGDRVNAMRDYQQAVTLDATYALAYFNAANIYFHSRQFKQALGYYSTTLLYSPKDESALLNRAITKVMLKNAQGALADFDKAIALSPHSAHIYFNRGNLYASLKEYDQAEQDYCRALSLQPDDAMVLKRRADIRGKLGLRTEAIADYQRAIEIQSAVKV